MRNNNQLKPILIIGSIVLALLIVVLIIVGIFMNKNPYGESIDIKNYGALVKNLSVDYEHNIEAQLYTAVQFNSEEKVDGSKVNDAYIRKDSNKQEEVKRSEQYSGSFIVDIASREESYKVQYAYSRKEGDPFASGYPIAVTCVDENEKIYKNFDCKDGSDENSFKGEQSIINFLPHETVSYSLRAELVDEKLTVHADLYIPSIDLSGNETSRRETVALYKKEVTDWISAQGFNPADYAIEYNYTDDGAKIVEEHDNHGEEEFE